MQNKCCTKSKNLKVEKSGVSVCKICGRKHYSMNAKPINLGIKLGK